MTAQRPSRAATLRAALLVGLLATLTTAAGAAVPAAPGAWLAGDEPHYLLTAISLAEDRSLDIADEFASGRYRPFHQLDLDPQGGRMPDGCPDQPARPLAAGPARPGGRARVWVVAKLVMAAMAGLLAALLVWTAVRRLGVPLRAALLAAGLLALSPPLAVYGTQVYPEIPATLLTTVAIALLTGPLGPPRALGTGAALTALPSRTAGRRG